MKEQTQSDGHRRRTMDYVAALTLGNEYACKRDLDMMVAPNHHWE